jgi:hypothetical protein
MPKFCLQTPVFSVVFSGDLVCKNKLGGDPPEIAFPFPIRAKTKNVKRVFWGSEIVQIPAMVEHPVVACPDLISTIHGGKYRVNAVLLCNASFCYVQTLNGSSLHPSPFFPFSYSIDLSGHTSDPC